MLNSRENPSEDARKRDSWLRFRDNRNRALAVEHGWLTLTSLQWLPAEPAPLEHLTGLWSANGPASVGGHATLTATADDDLYFMETGEPAVGTFTATLGNEESLFWVRRGSIAVELAARGDRYAVRTRDNDSPVHADFEAVPVFDYNPDLVVAGMFEEYDQPQILPIGTSNPDVPGAITAVGTVSFELDGTVHRLVAEPEKLGALSLNFHDATNGDTTAGWRSVATRRPGPDGSVLIDFNRATNFPSAFTDFGTCPMPVDGNVIAAPVEAGERRAR
ncbi:DUF1684 domain-containing protein [Arthrobacter sp. CAU 1506]|uniref:DUF1684 domain-containing protein n=1 Tax=Arthrobacter sp. CAU 1506 TaxID=2560052 RepID=UPI0010AD5101|nr:DUF1684 domain-containing protein [Arthrobacter sp. CAU 1506]TJY69787.1 DUF1684 domain-containing protein [Arthrobacter sp. CAU 1506]